MRVTRVWYGGRSFDVSPTEHVADLKNAVSAAVRDGAGFVEFRSPGDGTVSLLVTPAGSLAVTTVNQPDDGEGPAVDPLPGHLSFVDWDL